MAELLSDYTARNVALGSGLLGVISGVLGCFAVLRRQGLLGDVLAHAALPGICLAYLLTNSKSSLVLLLGAAIAGWLAALALLQIVQQARLGEDSALGIVLSTFFAVGITLLTFLTKRGDAQGAGLDRFLFGQAAALIEEDVFVIAVLAAIAIGATALFYKEFKLLTFDALFARSIGLPTQALSVLLTSLVVVAIVIGLQTVGVVLMAAMLIGPAVAARQWTNRLGIMIVLAALFGAAAGLAGALLSLSAENIPTGPVTILSLTLIVVLSLLFAPARGLVWRRLNRSGG
ncbi:MAG: metal ABC transporter permease [Chloroflexi bacterium]|nr:metal ABC transporter permease [Chloroflexota bacterium]